MLECISYTYKSYSSNWMNTGLKLNPYYVDYVWTHRFPRFELKTPARKSKTCLPVPIKRVFTRILNSKQNQNLINLWSCAVMKLNGTNKNRPTQLNHTKSTFNMFDMSAIIIRVLCLESSTLPQTADADGTCKSVGTCSVRAVCWPDEMKNERMTETQSSMVQAHHWSRDLTPSS